MTLEQASPSKISFEITPTRFGISAAPCSIVCDRPKLVVS